MVTKAAQSAGEEGTKRTSEAHEEQRQCPYCEDFSYVNTKSGKARYANHVRPKHSEEMGCAKARQAAEEQRAQLSPWRGASTTH